MKKLVLLVVALASLLVQTKAQSNQTPHLEKRDNHFALIVDGKPFFVLGGQINNSSAWPATLPGAWSAAEAMHANTVEAPVYWEQMERTKGTFDFSNVDLLVTQAREHHVHLVLLWFGTWKNGQNHYVPEWMKSDPKTYPREENDHGCDVAQLGDEPGGGQEGVCGADAACEGCRRKRPHGDPGAGGE
ncbi:MAG TPA: hypothetical protein VGN01_14315 [Acidobacteriaceae bacterium]|jgi:beta-galactosidase GanA